ncbi:50S ribosomal protein L20 [Enterobacteriaceae endosymbiont of Plateumaris braccata]|uniref:50S ribosomal protein L20 n=1 Tax=Enterobacteriaceae endosymbiont of Plateumaris braccata TaxID=2675793 RepID=UPI001449A1F1|nr:50S ribosomal protein L20 [Enterobacteriaceae endosymbiont of Plateumaris braccata]QJC28072.1 50S ribosomal protein L20 [Enterobacteriaceae endosymbiont of Plateumaris braccata]
MARVKRGVISHTRHKKIIKQAKGYLGSRSRTYRSAFQAIVKAGQYSYRDRRQRKRKFRQLWIIRINAAARQENISYSCLMNRFKKSNININRKILSELAIFDKQSFTKLINFTKIN